MPGALYIGLWAWIGIAPSAELGPKGAQASAHWVFFSDRDLAALTPEVLDRRAAQLDPRSLARRRLHRGDGGVDHRDLPPSSERTLAVTQSGARLRTQSAWLNAVSIDATSEQLAVIRSLSFVREVAPVRRVTRSSELQPATLAATDDRPVWQHVLDLTGASYLQGCGLSGAGVVVGMLDSGYALEHPALAQLDVLATRDFVQDDEEVGNEAGDDASQDEHGTATLSVLAGEQGGQFRGTAPGVSVILAKTEVVDEETVAEEDLFVAGLEWIESQGADISSASLGYHDWYEQSEFDGQTAPVSIAVDIAADNGMLHVNSAGNLGPEANTVHPPADAVGSLTVGSIAFNGVVAESSSRGPTADGRQKPELVAPGVRLQVAAPGEAGVGEYIEASGTSLAAPQVAGLAAMLMEAYPDEGAVQIRERLLAHASLVSSPTSEAGWGLVDGRAAVDDLCLCEDVDGDGWIDVGCAGEDCDDGDESIHPGAEEVCSGADDDCDGAMLPGEADADGDGVPECAGDCDDSEPRVSSAEIESCDDDIDNDCDGDVDFADVDCANPAEGGLGCGCEVAREPALGAVWLLCFAVGVRRRRIRCLRP